MVTVPGFYEMGKKAKLPLKPVLGTKLPVVVIRSDKPSPEVIWPEKLDSLDNFSNPPTLVDPGFQSTNTAFPKLYQGDKTEEGSVHVSSVVLEKETESRKSFEVTLETLDKEIAMFDVAPSLRPEFLNPLGPPNLGPTLPTNTPNTMAPLANITNLSPIQDEPTSTISPKWTQIERQVGSNEGTEVLNITLGKRIAHLPHNDSKPPKRRTTYGSSQKENYNTAVEAGFQPCREQ